MRISRLVLLCGALCAVPTFALAQTGDMSDEELTRAIELFDNGATLYEEGQYEEAILAWEESYRISGEPLLVFNIANAYERVGGLENLRIALGNFNQYRAYAPSDERDTLERRIRNLEARIEDLEAAENERQTEIEAERLRAEALELERQQEQQENEILRSVLDEEYEPYPTGFVIVRYSLLGVGLTGLGLGTVVGLQASGHHSDAEALCGESGLCPSEAQALIDDEASSALLADISFGVGAAATIGFLLTYIIHPDRELIDPMAVDSSDDVSLRFQPTFGRNGAGFALSGQF